MPSKLNIRGMGNIGVIWVVDPTETAASVLKYGDFVLESLRHELEAVARKIEAWAKANHPWTNRTGDAEAGLKCEVFEGGFGFKIALYHSVYYGIFLEVKFGGRDGVIVKAMSTHYGDIVAAMQRAL